MGHRNRDPNIGSARLRPDSGVESRNPGRLADSTRTPPTDRGVESVVDLVESQSESPDQAWNDPNIGKVLDGKWVVQVDWLAFTLRDWTPNAVRRKLKELIPAFKGTQWQLGRRGMNCYQCRMVGPAGALILFGGNDSPRKDGPDKATVHVILPGQTMGLLDARGTKALCRWVVAQDVTIKRCDLAGDDYGKQVSPAEVKLQVLDDKHRVSHHQVWSDHESGTFSNGPDRGRTFYLGSASSCSRMRVYDKDHESKGKTPTIRWEMQMRDDRADQVVRSLAIAPEGMWGKVFVTQLLAVVDFVEDKSVDCRYRKRSGWFARMVGRARKSVLRKKALGTTLMRTFEHLVRQRRSLVLFMKAVGGDWAVFHGLLDFERAAVELTPSQVMALQREQEEFTEWARGLLLSRHEAREQCAMSMRCAV